MRKAVRLFSSHLAGKRPSLIVGQPVPPISPPSGPRRAGRPTAAAGRPRLPRRRCWVRVFSAEQRANAGAAAARRSSPVLGEARAALFTAHFVLAGTGTLSAVQP